MIRATANQSIGAQMIASADGSNFTGTVTVYLTIDNGLMTIGSVGAGVCTHEGLGYHSYAPSAAETDGAHVAFTFTGSGAITATIQVATVTQAVQSALSTSTATNLTTVRDIITQALKIINVVPRGSVPTPEDLQDGFVFLNDMVDAWRTETLLLAYTLRTTWTLDSTTGTVANPYTVGDGGDIDIIRPAYITQINYQDTTLDPVAEYATYTYNDDEWRSLTLKDLTSTQPLGFYYNPTFAAFMGSLHVYGIPTQTGLEGVIYTPSGVDRFGSVNDTVVLPSGWNRALKFNLAEEMGGTFRDTLPVDPRTTQIARESKAMIKRSNFRPMEMSVGNDSLYSIESDTFEKMM